IAHHMPTGVTGLTLAAVLAAAMSTLSSSLNASASTFVNDLTPAVEPRRKLFLGRAATVFFGAIQIVVGIGGQRFERSVLDQVLAIAGFTSGVILGVFVLGLWGEPGTPTNSGATRPRDGRPERMRISEPAALVGLAGGLLITATILFTTSLAWPWYSLVAAGSTIVCGRVYQAWLLPRTSLPLGG
ncbi:MAG TPA: hypothetical protein VIY86_09505, partial [Pirellulaceae bacterium]